MKQEYRKHLEDINAIEIEIFAQDLGLITKISGTRMTKTKGTLISEILDFIFANNKEDAFYDFCSKGVMLFYPMKIEGGKNKLTQLLTANRLTELKKNYKIVSHFHGTVYYPKETIKLFSDMSIFIPANDDHIILFKKYANNKLALLRGKKHIEHLFGFKLIEHIDDDVYYQMLDKLKQSNLKYKFDISNTAYVAAQYVSHQFKNTNITISSKLSYVRASSKEIFPDDPTTSEAINERLNKSTIPAEINYAVNIPSSNKRTIESCGINLYFHSAGSTTRYAINMRRKELKVVQTDTHIEDLYNVTRAISLLNSSF